MYYKADLSGVEESIKNSSSKEIQCISGNIDPFANWEKTKYYFEKLSLLAKKYKKDLVVRTKILPLDPDLLGKFARIELVINPTDGKMFERLAMAHWWIKPLTKIGVLIETSESTPLERILDFEDDLRNLGISDINLLSK